MLVTLGQTTNFTYIYQDIYVDAKRRAQALMATCEADLVKIEKLFGVSGGFGVTNRVTLQVDSPPGDSAIALNNGYRTDGSTLILMDPQNLFYLEDVADDAVRSEFIAEFAEVLMDYRAYQTGTLTWNPGHSDGEGLSQVMAAYVYENAYYNVNGGVFINPWLQSSTRTDWITSPEGTDKDQFSIGCSMLFIYYLYSQLGYPIDQIITQAGNTLEATYQALTGNSGGYNALTQLLNIYLPIGDTPEFPYNDIFPLGGPVAIEGMSFAESNTGPSTPVASGSATLSPGYDCPAKTYQWTLSDVPQDLICMVSISGFVNPVFEWSVNGQKIGISDQTLLTTCLEDNPNDPDHPKISIGLLQLSPLPGDSFDTEASTYQGLAGELQLLNLNYVGHALLDVSVVVTEKYATTLTASTSAVGTIDTQVLTYDAQYYKDRQRCLDTLVSNWSRKFQRPEPLPHWVFVLLHSPDPAMTVLNGARVLLQLAQEIEAVAARDPGLASDMARVFSSKLNVPRQWLLRGDADDASLDGPATASGG